LSAVLPQAAPRHAFRELWLITIGHGLTHWYPATFYLLLPIIDNELGLTYSQIGLIMTCSMSRRRSPTCPAACWSIPWAAKGC
jgi:hypothetical protein